jgi:hypothetical protein
LIQIKIQLARPPRLIGMEAIFDLQTRLGKFGSRLRKSVQVCAEIWHHVVDAEPAIQRIEQQLRAAAVAANVDSTPRILASGNSRPQAASQEVTRDDFTARLRGPLRPR